MMKRCVNLCFKSFDLGAKFIYYFPACAKDMQSAPVPYEFVSLFDHTGTYKTVSEHAHIVIGSISVHSACASTLVGSPLSEGACG